MIDLLPNLLQNNHILDNWLLGFLVYINLIISLDFGP